MSNIETQLALVFPEDIDAEMYVDNITCMMELYCNVAHVLYELENTPHLIEDEQGRYMHYTCCAIMSNFPNTPVEKLYIDSIDSIDNKLVTITVGKTQ